MRFQFRYAFLNLSKFVHVTRCYKFYTSYTGLHQRNYVPFFFSGNCWMGILLDCDYDTNLWDVTLRFQLQSRIHSINCCYTASTITSLRADSKDGGYHAVEDSLFWSFVYSLWILVPLFSKNNTCLVFLRLNW